MTERTTSEGARRLLVEAAGGVLDRSLNLVEGLRRIVAAHRQLGDDDDPEMIVLIGVESETDDLPIGPERRLWDQSAVTAKGEDLSRYLEALQERVLEACRTIIERMGG